MFVQDVLTTSDQCITEMLGYFDAELHWLTVIKTVGYTDVGLFWRWPGSLRPWVILMEGYFDAELLSHFRFGLFRWKLLFTSYFGVQSLRLAAFPERCFAQTFRKTFIELRFVGNTKQECYRMCTRMLTYSCTYPCWIRSEIWKRKNATTSRLSGSKTISSDRTVRGNIVNSQVKLKWKPLF